MPFLSTIFLITNIEIVIFIHKTLSQYAPSVYFQRPQSYTRAAYYEQYDDQEYTWATEKSYKHRKRHKHTYYSDSSEFDYGSNRLKCKCSCRKCRKNKHSYYDQQNCCVSFCINCSNKNAVYDFDYTTQTTTTEMIPQSGGNLCPSLPWFECYQQAISIDEDAINEFYKKISHKKKHKKGKKDKKDKDDDDDENSEKDKDKRKDKDEDKDKNKDKDKDKDKDNDKDNKNYTTTITSTNSTTKATTTTIRPSESTVPYRGNDEGKLLLNSFNPRKKPCLRNNCLRDNTGRKIGRYFYNDLALRPTVGTSYSFANY